MTGEADRTLYLPLIERGFPAVRKQKRGLKEALARVGAVVEIDWCNELHRIGREPLLQEIREAAKELDPTLVLCQFHDAKPLHSEDVRSLRSAAPHAAWVNWNGDYRDFSTLKNEDVELASAFDVQLVVSYDGAEEYNKRGIQSLYWQIGWEPDGAGCEPHWLTPHHELIFLANLAPWHHARRALVEELRSSNVKLGLYGIGWPLFWARGACLYDFKRGCRLIRAARLVLADNPAPNGRGYVSNRLFQSLAAGGAMLLIQYFREYETLGLVDGQHCVVWKDFDDLMEKVGYWLLPENERRRAEIATAGQKLCLERHSFDVRVRELLQMLSEFKDSRSAR